MSGSVIEQCFLPGIFNADTYLELLENAVNPALIAIIENDQRYHEENAIVQQDGASPHYALPVRHFWMKRFLVDGLGEGVLSNSSRDPRFICS